MALKAPFLQIAHQFLGGTAGFAVGAVVRAHDGFHLSFLHQLFEGGQVGFVHVLFAGQGVELVAQVLWAGMHREVLGAGAGFQHVPLALQTAHVSRADFAGQCGVLAEGFLTPAPAGVAENVDVRAPEGEALVNIPVPVAGGGVVLGAALGGGYIAQFFYQSGIKGGGHADGLGEHGGHARPGHAVQRFIPPVVSGHAQTFDGGSLIAQLGSGFFHGHLVNQRLGAFAGFFAVHDPSLFLIYLKSK